MYGMVSSQSSAAGRTSSMGHARSRASDSDPRQSKSVYRRVVNIFKQAWSGVKFALDSELEAFELDSNRHKSKGLQALCRSTNFNRQELQLMYRGFKQICPSGIVTEDVLRDIYSKFFPHGGEITFEDFAVGLSILLRGSLEEKLRWTFNLYDINRDGHITKEEMLTIVTSIYGLLGKSIEPQVDDNTAKNHVERVFQKLDINQDGVVTLEEFLEFCSNVSLAIEYYNILSNSLLIVVCLITQA
ncbi:hypothetical protein CHUAL_010023 [Chamberlinius hualienensis]